MCLVVVAVNPRAEWPLVVAANRDERHARPAAALHWWPDRPGILAGRDRLAGGTWMGASASGRFACLLNAPHGPAPPAAPSRGTLVPDFLECADAAGWRRGLVDRYRRYAGFHLLTGDRHGVHCAARGQYRTGALGAGLHVVDNAGLDPDDPRSARARACIAPLLAAGEPLATILDALGDRADPGAGAGDARPVFIAARGFGTRCSTVLRIAADGRAECRERRFDARGAVRGDAAFSWQCADAAPAPCPG